MNAALMQDLAAWLASTDIDALELRGPGVHLCLLNRGGQVEAAAPDEVVRSTLPTCAISAPSVGVFLHAHPLQLEPLAVAGQAVEAGQVLGLLRIGTLLLPVIAPQPGLVAAVRAPHGATVGYGTPLFELSPQPQA